MKTMLVCDFATMKTPMRGTLLLCLFLAVVLSLVMESLCAGLSAVAIMLPTLYLISVCASDEQQGWERFRLTLPMSRTQVVWGRYASTLLVAVATVIAGLLLAGILIAVVALIPVGTLAETINLTTTPPLWILCTLLLVMALFLFFAAVMLPLFMRYGMTKAVRFVPAIAVLAVLGITALMGNGDIEFAAFSSLIAWLDDPQGLHALLVTVAILAVALCLYGLSGVIASRVYQHREL